VILSQTPAKTKYRIAFTELVEACRFVVNIGFNPHLEAY